jgi:hypothetical protein
MDAESDGSISNSIEAGPPADYNAPSEATLLATGSKQLALGLWGLGFFYTIMR